MHINYSETTLEVQMAKQTSNLKAVRRTAELNHMHGEYKTFCLKDIHKNLCLAIDFQWLNTAFYKVGEMWSMLLFIVKMCPTFPV